MTMQRKLALRPFHLRIRDRVENALEKAFAFVAVFVSTAAGAAARTPPNVTATMCISPFPK
jgi:hypothetical protein